MKVILSAAVAIAGFAAAPAFAEELHACGTLPVLPAMFDVETANIDQVKLVAAEYKAYQDENTKFIDCLKDTAKSDSFQALGKKERKKKMKQLDEVLDETVNNEQVFADAFNENVGQWREKQLAAAQ